MAEYKNSLNLPETSFPMKASLAQREPEKLRAWQENKLYEKIRQQRAGAAKFILHDGPPYANGHLHCGHALNKILKDIIIKAKTMSGYDAPFVPGWDCHGLPIELNVEKKIGKAGVKVTAEEFREKCREYAKSQIDIQRDEFQRLGVFGDWYHPYETYDFHYEANIIRALALIIKNGHLQQGMKPVHWCIDCGSALAEAEVEYEEKTSPSIDVAFYAVEAKKLLALFMSDLEDMPVVFPIWTTTPWSLMANEAVCLNPEVQYQLIKTDKQYFIIATELVAEVMERYDISDYERVGEKTGNHFEFLQVQHPFLEKQVPLILGLHVTTDSGTGCVHTAPAHGPDDYHVGQAYQLPLINPVRGNGCYINEVPFFANQSILRVSGDLIALLQEKKMLLSHRQLQHSYPHCWRHKTPMLFLATPQWFISMEKNGLRSAILNTINEVTWIPDWGKQRIAAMIETRPDWCISRQRAWGTPMPLFVHKDTRTLHPNTLELLEKIAQVVEKRGIDAWFSLPISALIEENAEQYEKITDTLDVWFDSGVSHFCVLKQNEDLNLPADIYLEGSDQHRGWFNSSLTTAVAMYGHAPYRSVLTHGYTVDAEGKKLSKSKGNYVALDKLVGEHGADILRLWVSSTDYRNEVSISEEIIKRNADAYRRIRNTARFLLANLFDFTPEHAVNGDQLVELDRWIIQHSQNVQNEIVQAYAEYNFHVIYQKIHNFCAVELGSFYLDVIKDRQYTTPKNSIARRSCQTAMYHILHALTRWLAPILSFTADEIWSYIPGAKEESVFLSQWYNDWPKFNRVDMAFWQQLQVIRDEVNKALELERQQAKIGSGLAAEVALFVDGQLLSSLKPLEKELRFLFITSEARLIPLSQKPGDVTSILGLDLAIQVRASHHEKCARCWHRRDTVGQSKDYPDLCDRCISNINGQEEVRQFA